MSQSFVCMFFQSYNWTRKHQTGQFCKMSVLGIFTKSWEALLKNLICSYSIFSPWKIVCVFVQLYEKTFLENLICFYGISFLLVFSWNFEKALLEILTCSIFCLSWKIYLCSWTIFGSPGKFTCVLEQFLVLLENLMCSYRRITVHSR